MTNYAVTCEEGEAVDLNAPPRTTIDGFAYNFVRWMLDGASQADGAAALQITMDAAHTVVAVYQAEPTSILTVGSSPVPGISITGDKLGTTNYTVSCTFGQVVNLTAPLTATVAGTNYNFIRWTVDGINQPDGAAALQVTMNAPHHIAVAFYEVIHVLTVQSSPVTGISIAGGKPGTTNYTASCTVGQVVNLSAPATATISGTSYSFTRWTVDGVAQPDGVAAVQVTMDAAHTVVAAYQAEQMNLLTVQSFPVPGIAITGDKPGTTNYTASCTAGQMVNLTAPPTATVGGTNYSFVRWTLDSVNQPDGQAGVQVTMNAEHTAVAAYQIQTHTLIVRSTPVDGIEIGGSRPGTTEYIAVCDDQEAVSLAAPAGVALEGEAYAFVRWIVDGMNRPSEMATTTITMDADHTAIAVYSRSAAMIVRGPVERGELAPLEGGGTFEVDIYVENAMAVAGFQAYLQFLDGGGADAAFLLDPATPVQYNTAIWPLIFEVNTGDHRAFGFMSLSGDADITEETWVATATFAYGPQAVGMYSIVMHPDYTIIGSGSGAGIPFHSIAGSVNIGGRPQLTVQSSPIAGVQITGDRPGTTSYSVLCEPSEIVNVVAPEIVMDHSAQYDFVQWALDGAPLTTGQASIAVVMDGDHTAVAVYELRQFALSVRSAPAGIVIGGDRPGTTPYDISCDGGSGVTLEAPATAVVASTGYRFARWTIDGVDQPDAQTTVQITMDADHAAEALYAAAPTLILRGPADRGEEPPLSGGGTFVVDVLVNTITGLGGFQAGLDFFDDVGTNAGFLVSSVDGDPLFGGMKLEFNYAVWPDILPLYVGDNETFGFMSNAGDIDITAETWVFHVTYEYPPDALGTYTIATDPDLTAVGGGSGAIDFAEVIGTVTIATRRTLTVQSSPFSGVAIEGGKPGTTDYEAICFDGQTVSLTAPAEAVNPGGVHHEFVRWHVDGAAQPDGQPAIDVSMVDDRTAVAEYRVKSYPLHVQSVPFTGVPITGDLPGTTDYTVDCPHRQVVNLTALGTLEIEGVVWNILHWVVNGVQQPNRVASVAIEIDGETTAVAVYRQAPRLIFKGPHDRGEEHPVAGGGTFLVEVCLDAFYGFGGMQVGTSFIDSAEADAAFLICLVGGDPDFGGMKVEFNSAVWPNILPLYTGDQRTVGFISLDQDIDITEETWVFRITYEYGSEALGQYTIKSEPDLTALGGGAGAIAFRESAGTVTIVPRRTLTVQSSPISGVPIGGDRPGTTEYSAVCIDQDVVNLQAPATAADGPVDYDFVHWTVDGTDQPDAEPDVTITMNAD
ncbi:MAG TPA: hypothetical protein VM223_01245, partial [Planctomycetota bacterium]|nr:hypothetical protein [Planctomycetota bacterium]